MFLIRDLRICVWYDLNIGMANISVLRRVSLQFFQEGNWTHDDLFEDTELEGDTEEDLYQRLLYCR